MKKIHQMLLANPQLENNLRSAMALKENSISLQKPRLYSELSKYLC